MNFSGKKALVIGGTGGIGKAVALDLACRGAELVVHGGSSEERLENTLNEIRKRGGRGEGFLLPVSGAEDAGKILEFLPDPDILVCAWGPFARKPLETLDASFWQSMVNGNLVFPGVLVSLVLPEMLKKKWGRILLFGGTNTDTIRGYLTSAVYSAAKTALGVVARSAARTIAALPGSDVSVTCNVVCPGLTDTEYLDENVLQYNKAKSPGGIPLDPFQISKACMDILENPWINGAIVPVDKGICL